MSTPRWTPVLLLLALLACGDDPTTPADPDPDPDPDPQPRADLAVEVVVPYLDAAIFLTSPPGDDRSFIVDQGGQLRIVEGGELQPTPWLDISGGIASGGERGLLGLAFDPAFASNGRFFLNFTNPEGDTRVVRYTAADPAASTAAIVAADTILRVPQYDSNHNGGMLAIGPDGYLYVAVGDGGGGGDPLQAGQDPNNLLGSLLRIDFDGNAAPGNPFSAGAGDARIWATGLRNPWRFSFDAPSGMLWVADVGQSEREEVNAVQANRAGVNYGWNVMEGSLCYDASQCNQTGLELPVYEYDHGTGCSVTGGYVYRGSALTGHTGRYFFSDFCSGFVRSFTLDGGEVTDLVEHDVGSLGSISSFGVDAQGELYLLEWGGRVLRLVESDAT
ncbi:PQQ-dependent sugar dehydrogenase [Gemmatimonadota bacterium DH-20]|uniref:PQQ-dependent sugar dehydrogenase n=1 Tax=Gaopeijia maritima TaxID=3119007 RepID=A0ABU9ED27_9BACT